MSATLSSASVEAVETALAAAVALVQDYAAQDPTAPKSCWQNPTAMHAALDQARNTAQAAWAATQAKAAPAEGSLAESRTRPDLRVPFMDMITTAFADVLEDMKESGGDTLDVDVLVDCLQSGLEILSPEDQEFWALEEEDSGDEDNKDKDDVLTPHEERRRERGFHVETTVNDARVIMNVEN
jgi:hypothetical protein